LALEPPEEMPGEETRHFDNLQSRRTLALKIGAADGSTVGTILQSGRSIIDHYEALASQLWESAQVLGLPEL
jgi:hypothetical protein